MAKVLLFVIEDQAGPGIRVLGSQLKMHGHQPILVFVEPHAVHKSFEAFPEDLEFDSGYASEFAGFKMSKFLQAGKKMQKLPSSFLTFCKQEAPDIIGFSTRFLEPRFKEFFSDLRTIAPNSLLIAGGHGPSVYTKEFLDMNLDCVLRGEGEESLRALADAVSSGKSYADIPNLACMREDKLIINPMLPPITDLDIYPPPLRQTEDIFRIDNNVLYKGDVKYTGNAFTSLVLAGRGCIGSCSYCAAPLWRNIYKAQKTLVPKHRRRSNEAIISEVLEMKRHGASSILFMDDYFIRPYKEMKDFFAKWRDDVKLPMFIHFSTDQLVNHPDLLPQAMNAGLTMLDMALQSGDEKFASEIFHRKNDNQAIIRFLNLAFDAYLPIMAEFIDGYLIDGMDDLEAKLDFISKMPFDPAFYYGSGISVMQLRIHDGSPLSHLWPKLPGRLLTPREFVYRAMLMNFRLIMNDEEFLALRENKGYKENPRPMLKDFHACLRDKQARYMMESAQRLRGQDVYFFGCQQVYQENKAFFSKCRPQAMLIEHSLGEMMVDGLPVLLPEEALSSGQTLPIVIFSGYAQYIANKIKKLRPDYPKDKIIVCERYPL